MMSMGSSVITSCVSVATTTFKLPVLSAHWWTLLFVILLFVIVFFIQFTMFGREVRRSQNKLEQRQRDRIRKDQENADRTAELARINKVMLKAEFECLGLDSYEKALKRKERTQKIEMELWKTALTLERREALRRLLEQDTQLHTRELNKIGLAIYQQRT